jgi:hypothetical protein
VPQQLADAIAQAGLEASTGTIAFARKHSSGDYPGEFTAATPEPAPASTPEPAPASGPAPASTPAPAPPAPPPERDGPITYGAMLRCHTSASCPTTNFGTVNSSAVALFHLGRRC